MGAEALRLPVTLSAQYWSGSAWLPNTNDGDSLVAANAPVSGAAPMFCTRAFAAGTTGATGNCKSDVLSAANAGTALRLNHGKATLLLQQAAPGRLNGSIDYQVSGGEAETWLPSTLGRATFGLYKAPVIYLREVY
jgi:MSHA biogenesis protein MshQ